jgi:hypothetical protein
MAISTGTLLYTLEELPELLDRLAYEPSSPEEIERRRKLFAKIDRFREAMEPIAGDIKDWIRRERSEEPGD